MEVIRVKDYEAMSMEACRQMISLVNTLSDPAIGLATGSTPEGLYKCLIRACQDKEVSFRDASTFNLDEYVGLKRDDVNSYHHYMYEKLFKHIDLPSNRAHLPDGSAADLDEEIQRYEREIEAAGGIDVQLLGLGVNGHIGFNEPGTSFTSRTQVVRLAQATLDANARFFQKKDDVPHEAITMGIGSIMESRKIILLASGEKKAEAVNHLINGPVIEDFPASVLQNHPDVTIIADEAALEKTS